MGAMLRDMSVTDDQILVISDGHISQHGTHEELMEQPGIYQDFVRIRMNSAGWSLS